MPLSNGFSQDFNPDYYARDTLTLTLIIPLLLLLLDPKAHQERALGRDHLLQER